MTHTRVWSLRRWRHECRQCRLPWRGKFEHCSSQSFEERYPARPFNWNAPTDRFEEIPLMTRGGTWRANGGKW